MSTYQLIRQAIIHRQSITCFYNGHERKMSPHVIGIKNGKNQALFYQYGGGSNTGLSPDPGKNWRCIAIDKILNIKVNNDPFQTAYNHSQTQTCVDSIDVEIAY